MPALRNVRYDQGRRKQVADANRLGEPTYTNAGYLPVWVHIFILLTCLLRVL